MGQEVEPPSSLASEARLRVSAGQGEAGAPQWEGSAEAIPPQFVGRSPEAAAGGSVKPRRLDFAFLRNSSPPMETHSEDEVPSPSFLTPGWATR